MRPLNPMSALPPPFTVRAPGRINLIGGHIDFHEGPVICCAIDRAVEIDVEPTHRSTINVISADFGGTVSVALGGSGPVSAEQPDWGRLVAAVVELAGDHQIALAGFDAAVRSDLIVGGGLSSSAAFEVALTYSITHRSGQEMDHAARARWAQGAEHLATGVPCGLQDQMASVLGGLVLLDCRDLSSRPLVLPAQVALVVIDSGVPRTLERSPWATRREESFADARALGVRVLRDAVGAQVGDRPRARHVVDEIARVWAAADALDHGDIDRLGRLMVESHESSRQLWQSSTPELDVVVEEALAAGAFGARLTGGGFGGCVVAICPADQSERMCADISERASTRIGHGVRAEVLRSAPHAGVI